MDEITIKEHGLLFKGGMVAATLEDLKTQTRRIPTFQNSICGPRIRRDQWQYLQFNKAWVDDGPSPAGNPGPYLHVPYNDGDLTDVVYRVYPRVQPGDHIWIKETWGQDMTGEIFYKQDQDTLPSTLEKWRPSIFMPRAASRITCKVVNVRAQRIQVISENDCVAEGLKLLQGGIKSEFRNLWNSINAKRGHGWGKNDWVWVYDYKKIKPSQNHLDINMRRETVMLPRPPWHEYFLIIAAAVAMRATCRRRRYGAVIVKDNVIISTGYCGAPVGEPNCCDSDQECQRNIRGFGPGEGYDYCVSVHAEPNAIIKASRLDLQDATLYVAGIDANTGALVDSTPCSKCKAAIKNAKIEQVYYRCFDGGIKHIQVSTW